MGFAPQHPHCKDSSHGLAALLPARGRSFADPQSKSTIPGLQLHADCLQGRIWRRLSSSHRGWVWFLLHHLWINRGLSGSCLFCCSAWTSGVFLGAWGGPTNPLRLEARNVGEPVGIARSQPQPKCASKNPAGSNRNKLLPTKCLLSGSHDRKVNHRPQLNSADPHQEPGSVTQSSGCGWLGIAPFEHLARKLPRPLHRGWPKMQPEPGTSPCIPGSTRQRWGVCVFVRLRPGNWCRGKGLGAPWLPGPSSSPLPAVSCQGECCSRAGHAPSTEENTVSLSCALSFLAPCQPPFRPASDLQMLWI